jgi:hypothetical protein
VGGGVGSIMMMGDSVGNEVVGVIIGDCVGSLVMGAYVTNSVGASEVGTSETVGVPDVGDSEVGDPDVGEPVVCTTTGGLVAAIGGLVGSMIIGGVVLGSTLFLSDGGYVVATEVGADVLGLLEIVGQ